jgi:hypothetical protein
MDFAGTSIGKPRNFIMAERPGKTKPIALDRSSTAVVISFYHGSSQSNIPGIRGFVQ